MPLLDHFHAPLAPKRHWESFHVTWASAIADALNERLLPEGFFAEEHAHAGGRVEIDVATFSDAPNSPAARDDVTTTVATRVWSPPESTMTMPAAFPDQFEVLVFDSEGGANLVAAIELISPANKDRADHRRAFAIKYASYLCQGIGLIIIDIVTSRNANLHNEMTRVLGQPDFEFLTESPLYAVAYRPIARNGNSQIDVWPVALTLGNVLPTLPLAIQTELCIPVDLEESYASACQRRRLDQ